MRATRQSEDAAAVIELLPEQISRYESQPRRIFYAFGENGQADEEETIKELARAINDVGQLHPVIVRSCKNDVPYQLIDGERRWRAIAMLNAQREREGKEKLRVRALVEDISEERQFERSVASNAGRENLQPIEEIWAIQRLVLKHKKKPQEIAALFSRSLQWAEQRCKIACLPASVIEWMHPRHGKDQLSVLSALELARAEPQDREALAEEIRGMPARHAALHLKMRRPDAVSQRRGRKPKSFDEQFAQFVRQTSAKTGLLAQVPSEEFAKRFSHWKHRDAADLRRDMESVARQFQALIDRIKDIEELV